MSARILIVEDDEASRALLKYLLEDSGYIVLEAADGRDGLHLALAASPDLVLCDMQMPFLNGYEVAQRLHANPLWRRVPLIAVTGLSMSGDREKAISAGFDDHLTKPIDPGTFIARIASYLQRSLRTKGPDR